MKRQRPDYLSKVQLDFTPFTALALVLFFAMLILNTLAKPNQFPLNLPYINNIGCYFGKPNHDREIYLFLDKEKIGVVSGKEFEKKEAIDYESESLNRSLIYHKNRVVSQYDRECVVYIIPLKNSNYGQLVHVLNTITKNKIRLYGVIYRLPYGEKLNIGIINELGL